jgi:hypothetical protein
MALAMEEDGMTDRAEGAISDDAVIWHYTAFASFVSILQSGSLWFTRLDRLRDPFEGRSEHPYKSEFQLRAEDHTRKGCVNCWTIDAEESELMWYAFAPTFGVAIQSTKAGLKSCFRAPERDEIEIGVVEYGTDWSSGGPESYAFLKRRHFKREQELRAYIPYKYEYDKSAKIVNPDPEGRAASVDLRTLFGQAWVAPSSPNWFQSVVKRELASYGYPDIPVQRRD